MGNLTYSYDADGRVVSKGGSLASIVMPQAVSGDTFNAANGITAFNSEPITYDPNGDLLNDGTNAYPGTRATSWPRSRGLRPPALLMMPSDGGSARQSPAR